MSPQSATAMQPVKTSAPAKQVAPMNIFDRMEELHNSIARKAFELFEGSGRWPGRELDNWLRAEVPGFSAKDLEINVEPRRLTVIGKRETKEESKKGKAIYSELSAGEILRVVDLPADIDTSNVTATLKDGILNVKMTKTPAPTSVRVELKAAG